MYERAKIVPCNSASHSRSTTKNAKHVVQHIKKFAYVKKKQYLCNEKRKRRKKSKN